MAITAEIARTIWRYGADTGEFVWLVRPKYDVRPGDKAGYFDGKYWRLQWRGKMYKASRVAWLMQTGEWPVDQIDHINGDRADDRFCNLREASNEQNSRNRGLRINNRLGIKGVSKETRRNSFRAQICVQGVNIYLGNFPSAAAAKRAYDEAARKHHGEFARIGA